MQYKTNILEDFSRLEGLINEYAEEVERIYKQKLKDSDLIASGKLINSVEVKVKRGADYYSVVFNAADYWKYAEGRKAGKMPPYNAILEWIRVKKILPRPDADGNLPTEKQLAFLIQRTIGEKGTIKRFNYEKPEILYETVESLNKDYLPLFEEALQETAEHIVVEAFNGALEPLKRVFG